MTEGKDIQVDGGDYTRIHHAILEKLATARLSGAEYRCILFLLRKTYGWNKKEDRISLSQWAEGTNSKRPNVLATLNGLIDKNIIYRITDEGGIPLYGFNKYIENWKDIEPDHERGERFKKDKVLSKQIPVISTDNSVIKADNTPVIKADNESVIKADTHNRHIDTIKDKVAATPEKPEQPQHKVMFAILAKLCRLDPGLKGGQIGKTAKRLLKAEYCPDDLEWFGNWWAVSDFRGKRGDPPTLAQVEEKILQAKRDKPSSQPAPYTGPVELPGYIGGNQ